MCQNVFHEQKQKRVCEAASLGIRSFMPGGYQAPHHGLYDPLLFLHLLGGGEQDDGGVGGGWHVGRGPILPAIRGIPPTGFCQLPMAVPGTK